MLDTIHTKWTTLRLATIDDVTILNKIYDEALTRFAFDPGYELTSPEVILKQRALPSNDMIKDSCIYCVLKDDRIIGYIELYPGFPSMDNVYISLFYITCAHRDNKVSEDILNHLVEEFARNSYKTTHVSTSLKTWHNLSFWHHCGFDTILSVDSDEENHFGRIELQYII